MVAASPAVSTVPKDNAPLSSFSPDVRIGDLPELVADGAIHPHAATTAEDKGLVDAALSEQSP
jgi:hypothetical protein